MFDWIYNLLYNITKSIYKLVDALLNCTYMLCGIDPVIINGKKTDLMAFMIDLENVKTGFKITALVGLFLIVFFSIWQIVKTITSEKPEGTPAQIAMKAFKSVMTFLFIPLIMYVMVKCLNTISEVLFKATQGGNTQGMGSFMALSFGEGAKLNADCNLQTAGIDYKNTSQMWDYINMRDYDYFFSWIAGIFMLLTMTKVLMIFIERLFSIVILYIVSPIPIAASIVDEGAHFKTWRDQLLSKFLVGYGALLGLNIWGIVMSALVTSGIQYFPDDSFLNFVFKVVVIVGGTFALDKLVGLIGNLVANGAGDAEMANAEGMRKGVLAAGKMAMKVGKKVGKGVGKLAKGIGKMIAGDGSSDSSGDSSGGGEGSSDDSGEGSNGGGSNKNPALTPANGGQLKTGNPVLDFILGLFNDKDKDNDSSKITNDNNNKKKMDPKEQENMLNKIVNTVQNVISDKKQ